MTKEEHNKIVNFVNSDDYMLLNSYISKPYEETIIEQDKEIERLKNIIDELEKIMKECSDKILKELNKNNHLSYGPALSINYRLTNYKDLKEGEK